MIGFAQTLGATVASFVIPAFVGLLIISSVGRSVKGVYLAAFAVGLYLWFFSDTISDSAYLSVDSGYSGGIWHIFVWVAFAVGLLLFISLDKGIGEAFSATGTRNSFAIPLLVAIAIGIHGFGEGAAIGSTSVGAPGNDILAAFGGVSSGAAFVLHKALEPMMIGAAYWLYANARATSASLIVRDVSILVVVFSLPGIIGSAIAYYLVQIYPTADFSYVFALGLGTSIYALVRLAKPIFTAGAVSNSVQTSKIALAILLGFTLLYLAALLHS